MKIMYFMDNNQILGGAVHTLLRQAALMKAVGHDVIIALDYMDGKPCEEYESFCRQRHMSILRMPLHTVNQPEDIDVLFILDHLEDTKRIITEERPDILHSVQINATVELAARALEIPHVMNIYPLIPDFFKLDYVDVFPRYHICDSQYYADLWEQYIQAKSVCIRTVADRADGNQNRRCLQAGDAIRCICVGAVYRRKNQLSVIMACHKAIQNGIHLQLCIYGNYLDNSYGEECMQYIQDNNLTDCMELKGFCTDMPKVYRESDVMLCGSTRESYPNIISEALANGVTVISTPVAGVPEIIRDGKNGYLSKGYRPDDLYEKIMEFIKDIKTGEICWIMADAERTYENIHSPEAITNQLGRYYQWLADNYESKTEISVGELQRMFKKVLRVYERKKSFFLGKAKIYKKLWYLYHIESKIKRQIEEKKSFYIWGTGKYGACVYELATAFFEDIRISGFVDSYKTGNYMDRPVYKPEDIMEREKAIILVSALNGQSEILEQLELHNKKYIEDYYLLAPRNW